MWRVAPHELIDQGREAGARAQLKEVAGSVLVLFSKWDVLSLTALFFRFGTPIETLHGRQISISIFDLEFQDGVQQTVGPVTKHTLPNIEIDSKRPSQNETEYVQSES